MNQHQHLRFDKNTKRNTITVSHIGNYEYLIKGDVDEARFIAETDSLNLSAVDIKDGPKIVVGKDFFGHGHVDNISILKIDPKEPLLLRVRLSKPA